MRKFLSSKIIILLFAVISIWTIFNTNYWKQKKVLNWDKASYQSFLPALFIYHDIDHLAFYNHIDSIYHPTGELKRYAIYTSDETKKSFVKYTCGVALFQLPFFFLAKGYCTFFDHNYPIDGYSAPFQLAVALSGLLFAILGLLILRKFLLHYVTDIWIMFTFLILCFGTNLYNYTAFEQGLSHIYLFFLTSCVLFLTQKWYLLPTNKSAILLSTCIGLCAITRPIDALIILIPIMWGISKFQETKLLFLQNWKHFLYASFAFLLTILPQLLLWKNATNHWVFFSYVEEGFNWSKPQIIEGLFCFRKGWFVYTPLVLLGFIGIYFMCKNKMYNFYVVPFIVFYPIIIYIIFSWCCWYYGGSFSCRPMVDFLPLLTLPIALLLQKIETIKYNFLKVIFSIVVCFFIYLNIFQTYQYNIGTLHYDSMNQKYYWKIFLKEKATDEDRKLLDS